MGGVAGRGGGARDIGGRELCCRVNTAPIHVPSCSPPRVHLPSEKLLHLSGIALLWDSGHWAARGTAGRGRKNWGAAAQRSHCSRYALPQLLAVWGPSNAGRITLIANPHLAHKLTAGGRGLGALLEHGLRWSMDPRYPGTSSQMRCLPHFHARRTIS